MNCGAVDRDVDDVLREVRNAHHRYSQVEQELAQRRQRLNIKQPEIEKCLDAVNLLIQKRDTDDSDVRDRECNALRCLFVPDLFVCVCV